MAVSPTKCNVRTEAHPQQVLHSVSSGPTVCNTPPSFQTPYVPSRGYLDSPGRVGWTWLGSEWDGQIPCRPKRAESLHPANEKKRRRLSWAQPESRQPFFEDTSSLEREGRVDANKQWKGIENSIGDFRHKPCSRSLPRRCGHLGLQRCTLTLSCTSAR